jgi:hypothetical protein
LLINVNVQQDNVTHYIAITTRKCQLTQERFIHEIDKNPELEMINPDFWGAVAELAAASKIFVNIFLWFLRLKVSATEDS